MIYLETHRLLLRRCTLSDVDNLVELDADPAVMAYLTGGVPTPREVIERETLPWILREYDRVPGCGRWAVVEKSSGDFLGWLALESPGDTAVEVELGYRLRRSAWGKGYATEGSRALIHQAFTELGTQRVYAQTMAVNSASRRVMEKAGLRYARTFYLEFDDPIPGTEFGEVEYELLRSDWAN